MLSQGDTFRKAQETLSEDTSSMQHRIQLAKSALLITLPEIAGGRTALTVIDSGALHPMEPIFTREVA